MCQYWYILSMDDYQYLSCRKLDEFLLNKEANRLVDLFAVPVKPSLLQLLYATRPLNDNSRIEPSPIQTKLNPPCQIQSHLAAIPDELILMIFHSLDLLSCFRLSLVSTRLWRIGWPFFQLKIMEVMSPWAGKRIICLGDEYEPNDLPAGFLTTEEENIVKEGLDDHETYPDEGIDRGSGDLLNLARGRFEEVNGEVKPCEELHRPLPGEAEYVFYSKYSEPWESPLTALEEAEQLPNSLLTQVNSLAYRWKSGDYYPQTESWILRNLTTAEIVQGDVLYKAFGGSGRPEGLNLGYPGFGEAIMSRICWSRAASSGACSNRGVWAGHRFELCTGKVHALNSDIGWNDVTSEIIKELSVAMNLPLKKRRKTNTRNSDIAP